MTVKKRNRLTRAGNLAESFSRPKSWGWMKKQRIHWWQLNCTTASTTTTTSASPPQRRSEEQSFEQTSCQSWKSRTRDQKSNPRWATKCLPSKFTTSWQPKIWSSWGPSFLGVDLAPLLPAWTGASGGRSCRLICTGASKKSWLRIPPENLPQLVSGGRSHRALLLFTS